MEAAETDKQTGEPGRRGKSSLGLAPADEEDSPGQTQQQETKVSRSPKVAGLGDRGEGEGSNLESYLNMSTIIKSPLTCFRHISGWEGNL